MVDSDVDGWYVRYMNMDIIGWWFNFIMIALIFVFVVLLAVRVGAFLRKEPLQRRVRAFRPTWDMFRKGRVKNKGSSE